MDVFIFALDLLLLEGLGASCSAPEFVVSVFDLPADPHSAHEKYGDDGDVFVLLYSGHLDEVFLAVLEGLLGSIKGIFPPEILGGEWFFSAKEVHGLFSLFVS